MTTIVPITPDLFSDIYATFLREDDAATSREQWHRLFSGYDDAEPPGWAILDQGRLGGILGTCVRRRSFDGNLHTCCNVHTWLVKPEYRGFSLFMLRPLLARRDWTLTDFTPTAYVYELSQRLGFRKLDGRLLLLPPVVSVFRSGRARLEFDHDVASIRSRLPDWQQQLFDDHHFPEMQHLWVQAPEGSCYIIYSRVERFRFPFCYIHYLSRRDVLLAHHGPLRMELLRQTRTPLVALPLRWFSGQRVPWSFACPSSARQLYRSESLLPEQVDTLYSEVSLLNLCTFPRFKQVLQTLAGRAS